ncbi:MAG: alpha/beta fold hydrolase [Actinomycetota bacterium]
MSSDLGEILLELTRRAIPERVHGMDASVVLECPEETWTMWFRRNRMSIGAGAPEHPDTIIRADYETLVAIQTGAISGAAAFLDGAITVRGNLNLALRTESLFEPMIRRPVTAPIDRMVTTESGWNVSVAEAGRASAPPVVLLHGLSATKVSFLPTMMALAGSHRVIVPDLLGHGDSSKPDIEYSPATFARFVEELLDSIGVERAHLIGNSLGGRIALEFGMMRPDRVASVTAFCPAVAFLRHRWLANAAKLLSPRLMMIPQPVPHRAVVAGIRSLIVSPDHLPRTWYDAAADEFLRVYRHRDARGALLNSLKHLLIDEPLGDRGFWRRLRSLDRPSMFVWGDRDPLVPAMYSEHVGRALPEADNTILAECGHVPQFEQGHAPQLHRKVRRFISRIA